MCTFICVGNEIQDENSDCQHTVHSLPLVLWADGTTQTPRSILDNATQTAVRLDCLETKNKVKVSSQYKFNFGEYFFNS